MRTPSRIAVALGAAALIASACTSGEADPEPTSSATASETPTASESTTAEESFALPDPVTEEYVDRVVNTIYEEWGAITREILQEPADPAAINPPERRERIGQLFAGEVLQDRLDEADSILRGARDDLRPLKNFTAITFSTDRIYAAGDECLAAVGEFDRSGTTQSGEQLLVALSLEPASAGSNVTGWRVLDAQSNVGNDGEALPDSVLLDASLDDLEGVFTTSCAGE